MKLNKPRTLSCEKGIISELVHFGVHTGGKDAKLKTSDAKYSGMPLGNAFCGKFDDIIDDAKCHNLKREEFKQHFTDTCLKKKNCTIDLTASQFFNGGNAACTSDSA
jgi:hypothetical protein